uniref:Thiamine pyrophosphate binding domain-containing protein n=1 Tax=Serendipita indica TaxID=65672 RepID=C0LEF0_SERIN|nr:thiamine pyrophosphate binding domain-containing protein [Serendipita indica]
MHTLVGTRVHPSAKRTQSHPGADSTTVSNIVGMTPREATWSLQPDSS